MKKTRGKLWIIEGIDGAGTTTQARLLVEALNAQGIAAVYTCQPSKGPVGKFIRQALSGKIKACGSDQPLDLNTMALLFTADRMDHVAGEILPNLENGITVVCDRYYYSTMAYQGVRGDMQWIEILNSKAPQPDGVYFLDISADKALARVEARNKDRSQNEIYENLKFLKKVVTNYRKIFRTAPEGITTINAALPVEKIAAKIFKSVNADMKRGK